CWAGVASAPAPSLAPPRSLTTTIAPSAANSRACSRPRPRPAPVMIATRPSSAPMVGPFLARPDRTPRVRLAARLLASPGLDRRQERHVDGRTALELGA